MNRLFSSAILVAGVLLLIFGMHAQSSIASGAKEAITGTPTDQSVWFTVLGMIGVIVGGLGYWFQRDVG